MSWTHDDGDAPWWGLDAGQAAAPDPVKEDMRAVLREAGLEQRGIGSHLLEELGLHIENAEIVDAATFTLPWGQSSFIYGDHEYVAPHWYRYEAKWPRGLLLVLDTANDGREGWLIWLGESPGMFDHFETLDWED